jgi:hypothetical protein
MDTPRLGREVSGMPEFRVPYLSNCSPITLEATWRA